LCDEPPDEKSYNTGHERRDAIIAASALIIGWFVGVYGTVLFLQALDGLTSTDRLSENVGIHAIVISELKLGNVQHVLFAHLMECADATQSAPCQVHLTLCNRHCPLRRSGLSLAL
jgi:cytochrome b subunit of formate dehydrogenase